MLLCNVSDWISHICTNLGNLHLTSKTFRCIFKLVTGFCSFASIAKRSLVRDCLRIFKLIYLAEKFPIVFLLYFQVEWMKEVVPVILKDLTMGNPECEISAVKVHAGILCGRGGTLQLARALNWLTGIRIVHVSHAMEKQCHPLQSTTTGRKQNLQQGEI